MAEEVQEVQVVEEEQVSDGLEVEASGDEVVDELEQTTTPAEDDTGGESGEPKKKGRYQSRIDELVRDRETEKEEKEQWRAEALRLAKEREKPQTKPEEIQVDISDLSVPKLEDFDFDEDKYRVALVERAAIVALRKERARDQQRDAINRQSEEERKLASWQSEGRAKYADFDVALAGNVPVTESMKIAIMGNEHGHDVAYFYGKNPQEAIRVANMHPIEQTLEINKLAKKLANTKKVKTESTAPSATSPVGDREVVAKKVSIYDPNISFKDYERIRMKQERERAGLS